MDKVVSKVAALGVPGLIFVLAMSATGYVGAAAVTTALAALGPGGMVGGVAFLGVAGVLSDALAKYGVDAVFSAVVAELYKRGESKETIMRKVDKYPVSKDLKRKLKEKIEAL